MIRISDKTYDLDDGSIGIEMGDEDMTLKKCRFVGGDRGILSTSHDRGSLFLEECEFERFAVNGVSFFAEPGSTKTIKALGCSFTGLVRGLVRHGPNESSHCLYLAPYVYNWEVQECRFYNAGTGSLAVHVRSSSKFKRRDDSRPGLIAKSFFDSSNWSQIQSHHYPVTVRDNDFEIQEGYLSFKAGVRLEGNRFVIHGTTSNVVGANSILASNNIWNIYGQSRKNFLYNVSDGVGITGDMINYRECPDKPYVFLTGRPAVGIIQSCSVFANPEAKPAMMLDHSAPHILGSNTFPDNYKTKDRQPEPR